MTLPVSPLAISLANLQTEFGGSNPISLNEYYAGGSYVGAGTNGFPSAVSTAIPGSGQISLSNFHGAATVSSQNISYVLIAGGGGGQPSGGGGAGGFLSGAATLTVEIGRAHV